MLAIGSSWSFPGGLAIYMARKSQIKKLVIVETRIYLVWVSESPISFRNIENNILKVKHKQNRDSLCVIKAAENTPMFCECEHVREK